MYPFVSCSCVFLFKSIKNRPKIIAKSSWSATDTRAVTRVAFLLQNSL